MKGQKGEEGFGEKGDTGRKGLVGEKGEKVSEACTSACTPLKGLCSNVFFSSHSQGDSGIPGRQGKPGPVGADVSVCGAFQQRGTMLRFT